MSAGIPWADGAIPSGLRILVVEDEALLAMMLQDWLMELGCAVTMAARVATALALAATSAFDIALLDVNVAGQAVYPVAEELDRQRIPFVFVTGYSKSGLRADYRDRPALAKPFSLAMLGRALAEAAAAGGPTS